MVFNKDVLFIHLGKTGGMSVSHYLCNVLTPPVMHVIKADEFTTAKQAGHEIFIPWKRHANLVETVDFLKKYGLSLSDYKVIIIVIRNPLEMDFSYFKHLNTPRYRSQLLLNGKTNKLMAASSGDYLTFAMQQFTHYNGKLRDYFEINGKVPENLHIIKFENLQDAIVDLVKPYTIKNYLFPNSNKSKNINYPQSGLDRMALESIKRKYSWIWDFYFPDKNYQEKLNKVHGKVVSHLDKTKGKTSVTIHIGLEKTGTTTIQEFLRINRSLLIKQGIYYPISIGNPNHFKLALACMSDDRNDQFLRNEGLVAPDKRAQWRDELFLKFDEELDSIKNNADRVILSSEHFSFLLKETEEIQKFRDVIDKHFGAIKIVVYLRRQDLLASSRFSNVIRAGILPKVNPVERLLPLHYYNFNRLLSNWSDVFPDAEIIPALFNKKEFQNQNLIVDFCSHSNITWNDQFICPEHKNVALSIAAKQSGFMLLKEFQDKLKTPEAGQLIRMINSYVDEINKKYPGNGNLTLRNKVLLFLNNYEKSNIEVARRWFNRDKLFDEDFSMYPELDVKQVIPNSEVEKMMLSIRKKISD